MGIQRQKGGGPEEFGIGMVQREPEEEMREFSGFWNYSLPRLPLLVYLCTCHSDL